MPALVVDEPQGAGFGLQQPGQLRRRATEHGGGRLGVDRVAARTSRASARIAGKSSCSGLTTIRPPRQRDCQRGLGGCSGADGPADLQGQVEAEPEQGDAEVLGLAPPLARLGADARGAMDEDDRRLDLVAVLAPRARAPGPADVALRGEPLGGRGRRGGRGRGS